MIPHVSVHADTCGVNEGKSVDIDKVDFYTQNLVEQLVESDCVDTEELAKGGESSDLEWCMAKELINALPNKSLLCEYKNQAEQAKESFLLPEEDLLFSPQGCTYERVSAGACCWGYRLVTYCWTGSWYCFLLGCDTFLESCPPTPITLISFTATSYYGKVVLEWETATEIDNAGFHIWRATGEDWIDGDYSTVIRLTDQLIKAQGDGSSYSYIDSNVESGVTYYYALEDIDLFGQSTIHLDFIDSAWVE
ncbi:MAG: hypothetical protein KAI83_12370 [Thiomargarita sp.]|nr:hypothetical protein [Thiomargarita sp.]